MNRAPPRLPPSPLATIVAPMGEVAPPEQTPPAASQGSGRFWFYLAFGGITLALGAALWKAGKTIEAQREEIEDLLAEQDFKEPEIQRATFRRAPRDPFQEPSIGSLFF